MTREEAVTKAFHDYWAAGCHEEMHHSLQRLIALGQEVEFSPCQEPECVALREATIAEIEPALAPHCLCGSPLDENGRCERQEIEMARRVADATPRAYTFCDPQPRLAGIEAVDPKIAEQWSEIFSRCKPADMAQVNVDMRHHRQVLETMFREALDAGFFGQFPGFIYTDPGPQMISWSEPADPMSWGEVKPNILDITRDIARGG